MYNNLKKMKTKILYIILLIVVFFTGYSIAFRNGEEKTLKINQEWLELYNKNF